MAGGLLGGEEEAEAPFGGLFEEEAPLGGSLFGEEPAASFEEEETSSIDDIFSGFGGEEEKKGTDEADSLFGGSSDSLFGGFGAADESDEENDGAVLGSIFDFASLSVGADEIDEKKVNTAMFAGADLDDDDSGDDDFDIMAFLAQQADEGEAEAEEDDFTIEEFINGSETVLDITLEQLASYIKKAMKQ